MKTGTKRGIRAFVLLLLVVTCLFAEIPRVYAGENTTYTYTLSSDDSWIRTQDAYLSGNIYLKGRGLSSPQDLFWRDGKIYIADTGNHRIVIYDPGTDEMTSFGENDLLEPAGLFVTENGHVYVADSSKDEPGIVIFSPEQKVIRRIGRPDSYLFSERTSFRPRNVVVSKEGHIFAASIGTYEGLMQFSPEGEFQGFFGANKRTGTLLEGLQDLIFTEEQKAKLISRIPRQIENIAISDRDLIYTVTQTGGRNLGWGASKREGNAVGLLNMKGTNILAKGKEMKDEWNFVDVVAGPYNNCYALTYTGLINEYDSAGNLLFSFGGRAVSTDRTGLFTVASAIDIDDNGFLYVLDKERALIQVFTPTDFAVAMHKAIYDIETGDYDAGEKDWEDILRLNGMSKVAHQGYGKVMFHQQRFEEAAKHFKLGGDHERYSDAFWEIRADWLNQWIFVIILGLIALYVVQKVRHIAHWYRRKKGTWSPDEVTKRWKMPKIWTELRYVKTMMRHPIDGFYYLKHGEQGSVAGATILYAVIILLFLFNQLFRGFIFNYSDAKNTSVWVVLATIIIPLGLFVAGNAMISSINAGEGSLKNVYVMTAYALAPYILIMPGVIASTYVLTLNEVFLINLASFVALAWSGIYLFLGVYHTHNYEFWETVKILLLTLFFMLMVVVAAAIMYLIWGQVLDFIETVWAEIRYRIQG